jgi:hypothetical protein
MQEIVWGTFETYKGNISKQHAFTFYVDEQGVKRNKRICGGYVTSEDGGLPDTFEDVVNDCKRKRTEEKCNHCLKKISQLSE